MLELAAPVLVFTALTVGLALAVLLVRRGLEPRGSFGIDIDGARTVQAPAGSKLLWVLAEHGVFLPAACGGRGACGQCRVTVIAKRSWPTPMEQAHIDEAQAQRGVRLACMVRIREALRVELPEGARDAERWTCEVVANERMSPLVTRLRLRLPEGQAIRFEAGAYVLLEAPPYRLRLGDLKVDPGHRAQWDRLGLDDLVSGVEAPTARAYSLANPPQDDGRVELLVRLATPPATAPRGTPPGQVSSYLFSLRTGDTVEVSGPFGDFRAGDGTGEMVLIAGGVGIAPLRSIVLDQLTRGADRSISLWFGARSRDDLCFDEEFRALAERHANFTYHPALSEPSARDEWAGYTGFVHKVLLEHYLRDHASPENIEYYLCGPPVMSAAVLHMLKELGVSDGQIHYDDFGQ